LDRFYFAYCCFAILRYAHEEKRPPQLNEILGQLYAVVLRYFPDKAENIPERAREVAVGFSKEWNAFLQAVENDGGFVVTVRDPVTGLKRRAFSRGRWLRDHRMKAFMGEYFGVEKNEHATPK
jgi:hypothetical protein